MRIRPATMADGDDLLAIRNDPEVVRTTESQKPVTPVEHLLWLSRVVNSSRQKLYVVESQTVPPFFIGYLRLDMDAIEKKAEVSIAIVKEWRGGGIGTFLVDKIKRECGQNGVSLMARVRSDNPASIEIFRKNGVETYVIDSDHSRSHWIKAVAE